MPNFKPKDYIAALTIVSFVFLAWQRIPVDLDLPVAVILGYYFVKRGNGDDNGH